MEEEGYVHPQRVLIVQVRHLQCHQNQNSLDDQEFHFEWSLDRYQNHLLHAQSKRP